jgi:hypothetical protein
MGVKHLRAWSAFFDDGFRITRVTANRALGCRRIPVIADSASTSQFNLRIVILY